MIRISILCLVSAALAGCGVELLTTTAVQSELQAEQAKALRGQAGKAAETSGRIQLERAIQTYRAENGANPPSLEALTPQYLPQVPTHADGTPYAYDPATGEVGGAANAAQRPTPQDYRAMKRLRQAINQYGRATGYYPGSLEALVPQYLKQIPRTSGGEPFLYNKQTGVVRHPQAGAAQNRGGQPAPGGGTPMSEAVTGMGVRQELNRMNQSGGNAAGSRMRRNVRQQSGGRNQQINETMDGLDL